MMRKMRTRVQVALQPAAPGAPEPLPVAGMRLMTSVAAAWVAQGFPDQELIEMTVTGCKRLPEASRLSLLQRLLTALPPVSSLVTCPDVLALMVECIVCKVLGRGFFARMSAHL